MILVVGCAQSITLPSPQLASISPSSATQGGPGFTLTVNGSGFSPQSSVLWNGSPRATLFQSESVMTALISPSDLTVAGKIPVTVFTPTPGGGTSSPVNFTINATPSPVPQVTGLSPSGTFAGGALLTIQVNGSNFVPQSTVTWNGSNRQTNFINNSQLIAQINSTDIASPGTAQVGVLNPVPGGGASNTLPFFITNAPPFLQSLSPNNAAPASTPPVVTATGNGFSTTSVFNVNGSPRTTSFGSSGSLTGTLTAADMALAGALRITIFNPPPGGGTSNSVAFNLIPTATGGGLPELVDINTDGTQADLGIGNLTTSGPAMDSTGRFIAFASISTTLVAADNDPVHVQDIFSHDSCLGQTSVCGPITIQVNLATDGTEANAASSEPSMSGDGRFVAFTSAATNLVAGATNGLRQVYLRDTCLAMLNCIPATTLVSVATDGTSPANGDSFQPSISPDGRFVAFASTATNLISAVTGGTQQIFLRDTCTGVASGCTPTTILVSTPDGTTVANGTSSQPVAADSGLFVAFASTATNLTAAATGGAQHIFLRGTCVGASGCTAVTQLVSAADAAGATPANAASQQPSISSDGRFIAFATKATNLASGTGGTQQVYLRDACTGASGCTSSTILVSTPDGTTPGNADSSSPRASANGQFVAFDSLASNLVGTDTNALQDVFVRNTCAGVASGCTASTVLASNSNDGTQGDGPSLHPAISGNGKFIAFISFATNLVPSDTNGFEDIFLGITTF
jgi:Tol biopolymer transport system component